MAQLVHAGCERLCRPSADESPPPPRWRSRLTLTGGGLLGEHMFPLGTLK